MIQLIKRKFHQISIDNKVDQVVAMIFRKSNSSTPQLLLLQRAFSKSDFYSGDLCFPGGHCEKGQSCLQTAIRETHQETNIDLKSQNYLGALNYIFKTNIGRSRVRGDPNEKRYLEMGVLMFQVDEQSELNIKLNLKEVQSYKWISFKKFLNGNTVDFAFWNVKYGDGHSIEFPAIQVGMNRQLWGLTFYISLCLANKVAKMVKEQNVGEIQIENQYLNSLLEHSQKVSVKSQSYEKSQKIRSEYLKNRSDCLEVAKL